ncbi:MAG: EAL domain-containing protein [Pseudomonadales bacterium]
MNDLSLKMDTSTLRILLSSDAREAAERVNNLFRNAGKATQTHRITSIEDLAECLREQRWDLALFEDYNLELDIDTIMACYRQQQTDTPVILLTEKLSAEGIVEGLRKGAQDVVLASLDEHLLHVAMREAEHVGLRRQQVALEQNLAEVSGRFELLMAQADDAVAYMIDGMHIDVNEAYAQMFGYEDVDELLCMPVIDLISAEDQDKFKMFLRHYDAAEVQELAFTGIEENGSEFAAQMRFAPASFDGEECTQAILRKIVTAPAAALDTVDANIDPVTHLYNRYHFVDELDGFLENVNEDSAASVLYIGLNDYAELKSRIGLSGSNTVRHALADLFKEQFGNSQDCLLAHYGEDSFTILLRDKDADAALAAASDLCLLVAKQLIEVDQQTVQCSCSIGVVDLNSTEFASSSNIMDVAFFALEEARQQNRTDAPEAAVKLYHPVTDGDVEVGFNLEEIISENRLKMMFQPIINMRGKTSEYYEASLRLFDAEDQEQPIDALMQSINQQLGDTTLDKWLVVEATKKLKLQRDAGKDTRLLVNLTQNSLLDEEFSSWLGVALKAAQLEGDTLVFQYPETTLTHYLKQAVRFNEELQTLNCQMAVSHFGRSLESFKTLERLQIEFVAVDGSYTLELQKSPNNSDDLRNLLLRLNEGPAHSIVPYVENAATLASLWQMNVHYIQGHYLQSPAEAMDYEFADMA